jgi:hypothetical protein
MGEMRNAYRRLVGKPAGKQSLGTPRFSEDNIKMAFMLLEIILETGCRSDDWEFTVKWWVLESKIMKFRIRKGKNIGPK